ncbi:hypothetical protein B0H13DRAFT_1633942 [Mycena leptocephala]|nr:hypothetical protein B0H13DRAFT_1633942 [Mycena leptocephala]
MLIIDINSDRLSFDRELAIGLLGKFKLRGIMYGGQNHFTCRFIDRQGEIWFHDGITTDLLVPQK